MAEGTYGGLEGLFRRCLEAQYTEGENAVSYCAQREHRNLYLLFQWSRGCEDWRNNFDFPAVPYRDMKHTWYCHRGFLRVWKSAEDAVADMITDPGIRHITVVGYSHGAALAVLAHEFVWYRRPDLRDHGLHGFGFGAPRVYFGSCFGCGLHNRWKNFTVVRCGGDLVTHLPPAVFGYRHVGNMLRVGQRGGGIHDHRPEQYTEALRIFDREHPHYLSEFVEV